MELTRALRVVSSEHSRPESILDAMGGWSRAELSEDSAGSPEWVVGAQPGVESVRALSRMPGLRLGDDANPNPVGGDWVTARPNLNVPSDHSVSGPGLDVNRCPQRPTAEHLGSATMKPGFSAHLQAMFP